MRFLGAWRLIGVCLLVALTWQVQAWRLGAQMERQSTAHAQALSQQNQAALRQQQAEYDKRLALEQQLSAIDQQHARELSDAQRHQAALRDRLATADVRLSVLLDASDSASGCAMPAATAAGGVVHAAPRARLDPAHAQRIIAITDDADNAVIALRACQAYVRAIVR
ncbi:lysis protein [Pseudomonas veronii]|jgi:prophage endopeptidase|uniref:Lysis protein n=1 Tax=Pseudomonas veronii TaxID=76761 RepID=A0A7Y0ZWN8_PSEVE|nr:MULTISPECIES: lysis system i-spanin subunit Rz [Pseudomonas]SEB98829.1 Bacteriophage Rz lysis protein [Pseudomonas marginalis]KRP68350.1 lysozyme [Pseudomonas veronii]NMX50606.1 lysis protein [Pseudomonas veronii]NMX99384.1 lysis protein [Pseudomonas veronii]NWC60829.1 lysis protein [Pseudomonas veronii]